MMDLIAYTGTALALLAMIFRDPRKIMAVTLGCFAASTVYHHGAEIVISLHFRIKRKRQS